MKSFKFSLITAALVVVAHLFYNKTQQLFLNHINEKLLLNLMFAVMVASVLTAFVWSAIKKNKALLSVVFVGVTLVFILVSRPVLAARLSFFLFFLLGLIGAVEDKPANSFFSILLIMVTAGLSEWLPVLVFGGVRFYWLDAVCMSIGAMAGRLLICTKT